MTHKSVLQTLADLSDYDERQRFAVDAMSTALDEGDADTARSLAEVVVGGDEPDVCFTYGFQMYCLDWLTHHYGHRYSASEDGSGEEEVSLKGLLDCLWKYKWIVSKLPCDIALSKQDIEDANDVMREQYGNVGFSMAALHQTLMHQSIYLGDEALAKVHFKLWQELEREENEMGDCEACQQSSLVDYYHFTGDYARAVSAAEPIVSGAMQCAEVPHVVYYPIIDSLIRLQRNEEAQRLLDKALAHITAEGERFVGLLPQLIQLKHSLGKSHEAEELLDEYSETIVLHCQNRPFVYLQYLIAVAPFNTEALAVAQQLAADFDQRNGNTYYQSRLAWWFRADTVH